MNTRFAPSVEKLLGREVTDDDRALWVGFAEYVREEPEILPFMEEHNPALYRQITAHLRILAIEARSAEWRNPSLRVGGRPEQLIPGTVGSFSDTTNWLVWLLMGGRGSGKSRTGAEAVREMLLGREWRERPRWALVGQTLDAVRLDMVENTLLEVLPPGSVAKWNRGPCELWLKNGAFLKGYSSEAPRKLRGPNFHGGWFDELATWKDSNRSPRAVSTTYSNAALAMRAHDRHTWTPRIIATTTPRSVPLLRNPDVDDPENPGLGIHDDPRTVVSNMSTLENEANLSSHYIETVVEPLLGTRLYDQEVLGMLVDEATGAQWSTELVAKMTFPDIWPESQAGGIVRVVIGVDPSVGAGRGDECGIVVSGLCADGRAYVLEDLSKRCAAPEWCRIIERAYRNWGADAVVVETNQGGELVEETLGRYAPNVPVVNVWAKKGKTLRAEPVALLSDQDRVRLAGPFPKLTTQMKTWDASDSKIDSPDRLDAFVYSILYLLSKDAGLDELVTVIRRSGRN